MFKKLSLILAALVVLAIPTVTNAQQITALYANENAPLTAPTNTAVGSGGSCTAGAHTVAVTIVGNYQGQSYESGLSSGATATCIASDSLTVGSIPLGSGYATSRNIYISKAGTTGPLFFAQTVSNNTSTSATFVLADANLGAQWSPKATPPMMQMFRLTGTQLQPTFDNSISIGDSTHRVLLTSNLFGTAGFSLTNATSGAITVAAPTGALGTVTNTLPALTGSMGTGYFCGASVAAAGACANTALAGTFHFIYGTFLLSGSTSTVTGVSPAFTSATSWTCVANDITTRANPVQAIPASASTFTITNTTGATDLIAVLCYGN